MGGLHYGQALIGLGVCAPDSREHRGLGVSGGAALRTGERGGPVLLTWHVGACEGSWPRASRDEHV